MSNPFLERISASGLSPAEEAALRHSMQSPYDEAVLPNDRIVRERALLFALFKIGKKCPEDPTGISPNSLVDKPTIVQDEIGNERVSRHERVCVQWFGEAGGETLAPLQFHFELAAGPDRAHWMGRPDWYQVAFIGKIKDWSKPEAVASLAANIGGGSEESYIAWVWTDQIMLRQSYGEAPSSFVSGVILLGNGHAGLICPRFYSNTEALDACIAKLRAEGKIRA